jgi:hypothetical protein
VPALIQCSRDSDRKIQDKSFVFSHRGIRAAGVNLADPSRQEKVPSPSCRKAKAAICTLPVADIRGNTDRIRNYYGKRPVA